MYVYLIANETRLNLSSFKIYTVIGRQQWDRPWQNSQLYMDLKRQILRIVNQNGKINDQIHYKESTKQIKYDRHEHNELTTTTYCRLP